MDEFELFRAQAYSGGVPSTKITAPPPLPPTSSPSSSSAATAGVEKSSQYLHEDSSSSSSNVRRRRHSSAVVGQDAAATEAAAASSDASQPYPGRAPNRDHRRHRLLAGGSGGHHYHQSLDQSGIGYDPRDMMGYPYHPGDMMGGSILHPNVTVAVEPPSPTETRRHQLNRTHDRTRRATAARLPTIQSTSGWFPRHQLNIIASSSSSAAAASGAAENYHNNDDDYGDDGDVARPSNVKRSSPDHASSNNRQDEHLRSISQNMCNLASCLNHLLSPSHNTSVTFKLLRSSTPLSCPTTQTK